VVIKSREWMRQGRCWGLDGVLDFMHLNGRRDIKAALGICAVGSANPCPVAAQCLLYALATNSSGVWGGTTHNQRKQLVRDAKDSSKPL
jgi:hypothetical protein